MTDDAIRESMVRKFHTIPGVGLSKAELLFDAGYTTISSLQKADADSLCKVKGISLAMARFIIREVKTMSDETSSDMVTCSTELTATSKPDDGDSATIKVGDGAVGASSISKPENDINADETQSSGEPVQPDGQPSSGGFFTGLMNSFKSLFGGSSKPPEQAQGEASPEAGSDAGPVTVKEDTGAAKPEGEVKPEDKPAEPTSDAKPEAKPEPKPDETEPKEASEAKISVSHGDEPKAESAPEAKPEAKTPPVEAPKTKKAGQNDKMVDDIIKELDLDKENR